MGATLCDCWSISDLQRCTDLYLDPARFYIPGVSAKLAASAFFWGVLSPVGSSLVSNSFPRIPYGDLLGILCADALEPVSGFLAAWDLITTPPGELAAFFSRIHMPTPVILGLLVVFRFFPTMRSEVKSVGRSMRNRGLTAPAQLVRHPAVSCEYVLVPLLLRCLQIADQLAVSAVARGAEYPGKRGSYYGKRLGAPDYIWSGVWTAATTVFLAVGGVRI